MKRIYLDYAATTPIDETVNDLVFRYSKKFPGNSSSLYASGREAKELIKNSKEKIGRIVNASAEEIIFTGSGTESDNLAILGIARAYKNQEKHIIVSAIEHLAVLRACEYLEKNEGFKVTKLAVGENGIVTVGELKKALRKDTILVSIMYANNEIGTIQPVAKLAKEIRAFNKINSAKILFHTDACQAAGVLDVDVQKLGVDLMTLNGSKIYGPKATGCLFVRRGVRLIPLIVGGSQERGMRAGTENPALIAGFARALDMADKNKSKESKRLIELRNYLISGILRMMPDSRLNGDPILRLPNNINLSFKDVDGEMLVYALDENGIEVSTGSACTSTSLEPSHVIQAINGAVPSKVLAKEGNLRVTLGRQTTKKDLDHLLKVLPGVIKKLRWLALSH